MAGMEATRRSTCAVLTEVAGGGADELRAGAETVLPVEREGGTGATLTCIRIRDSSNVGGQMSEARSTHWQRRLGPRNVRSRWYERLQDVVGGRTMVGCGRGLQPFREKWR